MMPIVNENDPRVNRTRELIIKALISVANRKGFDSITIKDITSEATINRATFYAHFSDKYELLNYLIRKNFLDILQPKIEASKNLDRSVYRLLLCGICEYFEDVKATCRRGFESILPLMGEIITAELFTIILNRLENGSTDPEQHKKRLELKATMISSCMFSAIFSWEKQGRPIAQDAVIEEILTFID